MEAIRQNLPFFFYPILSPDEQFQVIEKQASEGQEGFIMPFRVTLQDKNTYHFINDKVSLPLIINNN